MPPFDAQEVDRSQHTLGTVIQWTIPLSLQVGAIHNGENQQWVLPSSQDCVILAHPWSGRTQYFPGFSNLHHRFIHGFSSGAASLMSLLRTGKFSLCWTPEAKVAFSGLKTCFNCFKTKPVRCSVTKPSVDGLWTSTERPLPSGPSSVLFDGKEVNRTWLTWMVTAQNNKPGYPPRSCLMVAALHCDIPTKPAPCPGGGHPWPFLSLLFPLPLLLQSSPVKSLLPSDPPAILYLSYLACLEDCFP